MFSDGEVGSKKELLIIDFRREKVVTLNPGDGLIVVSILFESLGHGNKSRGNLRRHYIHLSKTYYVQSTLLGSESGM